MYTLGLHTLRPALALAGRQESKGKLARAIRGRRGVLERIRRWSETERDPGRKLLWFHAPSVGEGLQARAVVEALGDRGDGFQLVYTFFSPSAERFGLSVGADFTDYLPFDLPAHAAAALDWLRPDLIAFSKTDVWPNLTWEATRRGVPMILLSGTLPASSSRIGAGARLLLGPAYRRLTHVAAISPADADRFAAFGVPESRRSVMGDARFDQVLQRAVNAGSSPWSLHLAAPERFMIVAGSTWPPDEAVLIPALREAAAGGAAFRLVLAPHEPSEEHLRAAEERIAAAGFRSQRMADLESSRMDVQADVVLVDRVGVLGDLYSIADLAYVGGGWGTAGLHSVLEPAAFGTPVLFGPRHANAREAGELVACGGAFAVASEKALRERIDHLWRDADARGAAGRAAGAYVEAGRGAAQRGAELVRDLAGL